MGPPTPALRKHLSADALYRTLCSGFEQIADRRDEPEVTLADALMSAFAMFALKDPSLLEVPHEWRTVGKRCKL